MKRLRKRTTDQVAVLVARGRNGLEPFSQESTQAYVKHRLRLAGAPKNPFSLEAVQAVHRFSGGTPRIINTLCDNARFEAFVARQESVDATLLERVVRDLGMEPPATVARDSEARNKAALAPKPERAPPGPKVDLNEIDRYLEGLKQA